MHVKNILTSEQFDDLEIGHVIKTSCLEDIAASKSHKQFAYALYGREDSTSYFEPCPMFNTPSFILSSDKTRVNSLWVIIDFERGYGGLKFITIKRLNKNLKYNKDAETISFSEKNVDMSVEVVGKMEISFKNFERTE